MGAHRHEPGVCLVESRHMGGRAVLAGANRGGLVRPEHLFSRWFAGRRPPEARHPRATGDEDLSAGAPAGAAAGRPDAPLHLVARWRASLSALPRPPGDVLGPADHPPGTGCTRAGLEVAGRDLVFGWRK